MTVHMVIAAEGVGTDGSVVSIEKQAAKLKNITRSFENVSMGSSAHLHMSAYLLGISLVVVSFLYRSSVETQIRREKLWLFSLCWKISVKPGSFFSVKINVAFINNTTTRQSYHCIQ